MPISPVPHEVVTPGGGFAEGAAPRRRLPLPRLLPLTILAMAALLVVKIGDVAAIWLPEASLGSLRAASEAMLAVAHAASPEPASPDPAKAEPGKPEAARPDPAVLAPGKPEPAKSAAATGQPARPGAAKPGEAPAANAPVITSGSSVLPIGEAAASAGPAVSDSERALLTDLRNRRQELDRREAALTERANVLTAAETRLTARLDELKSLQTRLEAMEKARQTQIEANWRGLVKVYEDMRPRDAAAICNELDFEVLIPVLDRMKEAKAATLLAAMDPARAREATGRLAKRRAEATTVGSAPNTDVSPVAARSGG